MVDRDLFELYVLGLEEANEIRLQLEELVRRGQNYMQEYQAKQDEWNKSGPHDPIENLGLREHSQSMRTIFAEMTQYRSEYIEEQFRFEDEFIALAREMLSSGNFDLKDLLARRLEETRHRLSERVPRLLEYMQKTEEARLRLFAFVDECSLKGA